jgi:hypothetical protein
MLVFRAARTALAGLGFAWLLAAPAGAVLIASGDGTGNTTPPADPAFLNVGVVNGLTGVYLGDGWVLTANHVGTGSITLEGIAHPAVTASSVRLEHAPGSPTDLRLFRLVTDPGLDPLEIATPGVTPGRAVVLYGNGRNRGSPFTWQGIAGFYWGSAKSLRWGTNEVEDTGLVIAIGDSTVESFNVLFDDGLPTEHEANAAVGDSGGGAFVEAPGGGYELAGILFAIYGYGGQPTSSTLYGNGTLAADLSYYRDQILTLTAVAACADGADDDGDGLVDGADPGCLDPDDAFETNALAACDDGFDDDGDLLVDWPDDPGCKEPESLDESPACDDGIDNDGDGGIDWDGGAGGTPDAQCTAAWRGTEKTAACGLGFELIALAPLLARMGRRRRGTMQGRTATG